VNLFVAAPRQRANVFDPAVSDGKGGKGGVGFGSIGLKVGNLSIVDTSPSGMTLQAHVNFTNPTNYSATVPYFNINLLVNGTVIGQGITKDITVHPGNNTNVVVQAIWDPYTNGGLEGRLIAREFLSQFISGTYIRAIQSHHHAD
jgi:hypothetical protein